VILTVTIKSIRFVANNGDESVSILLGYGNGSFAIRITLLTGLLPESVAIGDFNEDNETDRVIVNGGDNNTSIFLGYGNESFVTKFTLSTDLYPIRVVVGDLNGDNRKDIVVTNF
jgi:hypothetical protein